MPAAFASVAPTDRAAHVPYALGSAVPVDEGAQSTVGRMTVGPGYFQTMQARVIAGRDFNDFDRSTSEAVAIVNQSFARRHAPANPAIGDRLQLFPDGVFQTLTIVGVGMPRRLTGVPFSVPTSVHLAPTPTQDRRRSTARGPAGRSPATSQGPDDRTRPAHKAARQLKQS